MTNAIGKILDTRLNKIFSNLYIISECQIGFTHKARKFDNMRILKIIHVID